jgi:methyl-accepting chemotaxis protein
MRWYRNRKIGTKIISVIAIMALLLAGVGVFGLLNLGDLNESQQKMYADNLLPITEAQEAMSSYTHLRVYIRDLYMSNNAEERETVTTMIHETKTALVAHVETYRSSNLSPDAREAIAPFDAAWESYAALYNRAMDYYADGKTEQMLQLIEGDLKAQGEALRVILQQNVELNVAEAANAYESGHSLYTYGLWVTISVIGVALVLCAISGGVLSVMISRPLRKLAQLADAVAGGDLTRKSDLISKDETGMLANAFNTMIDKLNATVENIVHSSQSLAVAAEQISASTEEIAGSSSEQAGSAQTIHALFEELSSAIKSVAHSSEQASELADSAIALSKEGEAIIASSLSSMNGVREQVAQLEQDSVQVGSIIEVIEDIADQTNLLALNAAIEAARAGEQGRGFAVVADEVRKLAERSGEATKKITQIIRGMQENTNRSVRAVETCVDLSARSGSSFEGIATLINQSGVLVSGIAAAGEEQAAQSDGVLRSVEHITASTEQSAAASEETAAVAQSLMQLSSELQRSVAAFKTS